MLWSDPADEPPQEMRSAQAGLRRSGWLLAVAMIAVFLLL
ncbi:morphogenic membrane protein MmpB [Streptomyces megasporus]